jgi:hypothetical protein
MTSFPPLHFDFRSQLAAETKRQRGKEKREKKRKGEKRKEKERKEKKSHVLPQLVSLSCHYLALSIRFF